MIYIDVDTAVTVPVNIMPLMDDTDFITRETAIVYNQAGMDLVWNFVTSAGVITQTAVTPTTGGDYDWTHIGDGMYKIEIPASGGASINNDAEGVGYFTGICTGVLAWRGPDTVFRAAALNDALIDGGDVLDVNTTQISGDSTAADNLELDYDGTGYTKANSTIGTCTTNTDMRGTDGANTTVPDNAGIAAVQAKTDNLPTDPADQSLIIAATDAIVSAVATVDSNVDAILVDTSTTIPATITTIDSNVDSVKVKTDQMVFTETNELDASMRSAANNSITSSVLATDAIGTDEVDANVIAAIAAQVESYIINEGDATAVLQAIADKVAADWIAGDASPLAIVAALKADSEWSDLSAINTSVASILEDTGTTIPAAIATVDSNVDAVLVDTGTTLPAQITALNNISVSDVLTTQMTEAYAADGAAPTLAESLFLIQQVLTEFGIVGTTLTAKKLDGSTSAATFTLDDADTPTSLTRAS